MFYAAHAAAQPEHEAARLGLRAAPAASLESSHGARDARRMARAQRRVLEGCRQNPAGEYTFANRPRDRDGSPSKSRSPSKSGGSSPGRSPGRSPRSPRAAAAADFDERARAPRDC